jgi:putative hemolysin
LENMGTVTQDELISMLDAGHQEGVVEQDEREMIYSIFRLNDTLTREIMVPRIYITALDVNVSVAEAVDAMLAAGHSRIPVYEETIDNILGLVYAKDMLRAARDGSQINSLRSLLREVYFVPEAKKVDELLEEMQARRVQMAIVVDEYGGIAGLVTMEDIVEEIVGEIRDEYDQAEEMPYQEVSAGEYIFLGRIALDDFNSVMGTHLDPGEAETLSGFIYSELGRVPESGEQFVVDDLTLTVEQVSGRRIRKVRASRTQSQLPVDQEPEDARFDR